MYIPGSISPIATSPVLREILNLVGILLANAKAYVKKLFAAVCSANCLRIRQSSLGPLIVRTIYYY